MAPIDTTPISEEPVCAKNYYDSEIEGIIAGWVVKATCDGLFLTTFRITIQHGFRGDKYYELEIKDEDLYLAAVDALKRAAYVRAHYTKALQPIVTRLDRINIPQS